ncbi:MAG: electron transfer flavoprotein subunit alpha/FixB family protein [Tetrasphaera sp.]
MTFARTLGGDVRAVVLAAPGSDLAGTVADCASQGVTTVHVAQSPSLSSYAAAAWAGVVDAIAGTEARVVLAGGSNRGCEILAHVAARRDLPMAANAVAATIDGALATVRRQVVGGAVIETMSIPAEPAILTLAGHAVEPSPAATAGAATVVEFSPQIPADDLRAQVASVSPREGGDSAGLAKAKVVIGAGRGAGSPEGFGDVDALAARLGGVVGVSRVVTSLGWRPHHEQIGQTGTRINPDLYVPCGISGAIQHWAGCASSKTIIAINTDAEAPMVTKAAYAIVGDMHEVIPAILAELG